MKSLLLDVYDKKVLPVEVDGSLEDYYRKLDCGLIEIHYMNIGGKCFDVICDEEGTFRSDAMISAVDSQKNWVFVGNLLFMNTDGEGNEVELSEEDIAHIKKFIKKVRTIQHPEGYPALTCCDWG